VVGENWSGQDLTEYRFSGLRSQARTCPVVTFKGAIFLVADSLG